MPPGQSILPERTENAGADRGTATAAGNRIRDGTAQMQCLRGCLHGERAAVGGPGKVRRHRSGDDRPSEVWYRNAVQPAGATGEAPRDPVPGERSMGTDEAGRGFAPACA